MSSRKKLRYIFIAILVLVVMIFASIAIGTVKVNSLKIFEIFNSKDSVEYNILFNIRIPRVLLAVVIGANLAVAGALLQAVMDNPLADPGVTGVSQGAAIAGLIVILYFPQLISFIGFFAFIGGGIACLVVFLMAWSNGIKPMRIVLSGVAVNSILGGFLAIIIILNSDKIQGALMWLNGSLSTKGWEEFWIIVPYSLVALALSFFVINMANKLTLGESAATSLGDNVNLNRLVLSALGVFLAAVSTAMVGIIGFIGLMVPHIARRIIGSDYTFLLPMSMVIGAITLLSGDTLGRTIASPIELPVGALMAIIGGPFFIYLLKKGEK